MGVGSGRLDERLHNLGGVTLYIVSFINRNIGVLSGRLLSLEGVNKTFIFWVELSSFILRDHLYRYLTYWATNLFPYRLSKPSLSKYL